MPTTSIAETHPHILSGFVMLVLGLLALDLFVLRKKDQAPSMRSAVGWCIFWFSIAMAFNGWIAWYLGTEPALTFLTGYIVEMSLSIDNLFVFILIFSSFKVPEKYQHRVLYWGILGALVMRAICIGIGVAALQRFEWLEFVFAAILVWAGIKTLRGKNDDDEDPTTGWLAMTARKILPFKDDYHGDHFFVRDQGRWYATPLLLVLILVEASDVIFAVDSIPAVLAVTQDPFLVYSSNIFAIMGLRSLYFVLARMVHLFRFLGTGVSVILIFIGLKMGLARWYHMPVSWALSFILTTIVASIVLSRILPEKASD